MITIRTAYNLAIREDYAERNNFPFGKGKHQIRIPDGKKIGLTIEEPKCLEEATGLSDVQQHALNVWLLSFYFAEMPTWMQKCLSILPMKIKAQKQATNAMAKAKKAKERHRR